MDLRVGDSISDVTAGRSTDMPINLDEVKRVKAKKQSQEVVEELISP